MKSAESKSISATATQKESQPFFAKKSEGDFFDRSAASESPFFKPAAMRRVNGKGVLQAKLTIGPPNDIHEKEADAVADKVVQRLAAPAPVPDRNIGVQKSVSASGSSTVQEKCTECGQEKKLRKEEENGVEGDLLGADLQKKPIFESNPEPPDDDNLVHRKCSTCEKEEKIQKKSVSAPQHVSPAIESSLLSSKASGDALPTSTREQMESSFGTDFSNVRIHTGSNAVQMSKNLHAQAFTHGNDIYFNSGKYDTNSKSGKHLLAHELTHTVQQGGSASAQRKIQRWPDWVSDAASWVSDTASDAAGSVVQGAEWVGGQVADGAQWVGGKVAAGASWVGDQVSAAARWVFSQIRSVIDSGISYLTEGWQRIREFGRTCFDDIKKGFASLVHSVMGPLSGFMSALSQMNADFLGSVWNSIKSGANDLWSGMNSLINGVLQIGTGIWNSVSGFINGIFDTVSGLFDNAAFNLLPDSIKDEARSILNGLRSLWNQVSSFWTDLWQRLTSTIQEILAAVRSFVDNLIAYSIDHVISMVRSLKEVYNFFTKLFADPHATIQPLLDRLAGKLNAEVPGRANTLGTALARQTYPGGDAGAEDKGAIQREPEDSEERTTATLDEVGKGILFYIGRAWAELDLKKMLWDTVVNMFWPPATLKAIYGQFSQLWNDDWATTVDSLYIPRNFFDDPIGSLHDVWSNFLILLDFPLALWRTLNNVVGLLMGYITIIIVLTEAILGGIAAAEVGVVPGILAGAAAGLATVAPLGEALMASYLAAESASVITDLTRLFTARQVCEKRQVDILTSVASFIAMAVALSLQALMAILSELVSLISNAIKGVPEVAPASQPSSVPQPAQPVPQPTQPVPQPTPQPAPQPAAPAGGGNVIPFPSRPTPVTPQAPGQVAAKFEGDLGDSGLADTEQEAYAETEQISLSNAEVSNDSLPNTEVSAGGVLQLSRKDRIDPDACKKEKEICYEKSVTFNLTKSGMTSIGVNPTPDDLRVAACVMRKGAGSTSAKFKSLNIAVGKFLVDGKIEYIPAANIPGGNIHSEDVILIEAKRRFGEGNYKLAALFSERVPCYRCSGNLRGTPLTPDCKVYCIINNDYNWSAIRRSYNKGVLV